MSDTPCTGCRSTHKGRLYYAYLHHYMGQEREERRLRLCKDCVMEVLAPLLECADWKEGEEWVTVEAHILQVPSRTAQYLSTPRAARAAVS